MISMYDAVSICVALIWRMESKVSYWTEAQEEQVSSAVKAAVKLAGFDSEEAATRLACATIESDMGRKLTIGGIADITIRVHEEMSK